MIEATKYHSVISTLSPIAKDQAVRHLQTLDSILFYFIVLYVLAESLIALPACPLKRSIFKVSNSCQKDFLLWPVY